MYNGFSSPPPSGVMRTWFTSYSMTRYGNHQHCARWTLSLMKETAKFAMKRTEAMGKPAAFRSVRETLLIDR